MRGIGAFDVALHLDRMRDAIEGHGGFPAAGDFDIPVAEHPAPERLPKVDGLDRGQAEFGGITRNDAELADHAAVGDGLFDAVQP